jgi:RNA polymerase sigma-70 factor (ECF subfamily)
MTWRHATLKEMAGDAHPPPTSAEGPGTARGKRAADRKSGLTAKNRRRISGPPDNSSVAEGGPAGNATMSSDDRVEQERLLRSAVLAGDQRAWQAWYDQSYEPLCRYVHWRSGGLEDLAEEVVQETWLVAVRRIRSFDPRQGSFPAWLRGIAANVLRNRLRGRVRTGRREKRARDEVPTQASAETELARREQAERIAHALADLPEHYEAVLRAKYLEGATLAQIAEASGQTPKAVESLLTRARQAFRERYQDLDDLAKRP